MPDYVTYRDDLEVVEPDEAETVRKIIDVMTRGQRAVREKHGHAVRISHAKAHGFLKGELVVDAGLPPELAQGLFARPGRHPAFARLAQVPGEVLDDRRVSTTRGVSLKVFDARGPKLSGHAADTQDFLLDTGGPAFFVGGTKAFLAAFTPNATVAPRLPEAVKGVVSTVAKAANLALHAVGLDSAKLDVYGHSDLHPLGESYYSQVPIRYGNYVAKVALTPGDAATKALVGRKLNLAGEDGLRAATVDFFRSHAAVFDLSVQLATDPEKMPVEDASVAWPEDLSPYRRVARLVLPVQDACPPARQAFADDRMSFGPHHSLAAHRPLGAIMRARLAVYPEMSRRRHAENAEPVVEPGGPDEIPD